MHQIDIVFLDLEVLDHDKLLEAAKTLQGAFQECKNENTKLESDLKQIQGKDRFEVSQRVLSFPPSSVELPPSWIRAQLDSPTETSWYCFGRRSKYRTVIVYDQSSSSLKARNRESLKGNVAGLKSGD
jgi:hypothetical protein